MVTGTYFGVESFSLSIFRGIQGPLFLEGMSQCRKKISEIGTLTISEVGDLLTKAATGTLPFSEKVRSCKQMSYEKQLLLGMVEGAKNYLFNLLFWHIIKASLPSLKKFSPQFACDTFLNIDRLSVIHNMKPLERLFRGVIWAPIWEEFVFRFLLQNLVSCKSKKPFLAEKLSRLTFAVAHRSPQTLCILAACRIPELFRETDGSFVAAVGYHMSNNLLALISSFLGL